MGRYYSGDIEGKFWFAVQSSDDASFFGGEECEPNYIEYYFDEEHLVDIEKGLVTCKEKLGVYNDKITEFFKINYSYIDEKLAKYLGVTEKKAKELLTWYARLKLGEKIYNCVKENGSCKFEAEL
jgi:hypothetical protein